MLAGADAGWVGENPDPLFGDGHRVLEMGSLGWPSLVAWVQWSAVLFNLLGAHVDHRLDGDHQARLQRESRRCAQAAG